MKTEIHYDINQRIADCADAVRDWDGRDINVGVAWYDEDGHAVIKANVDDCEFDGIDGADDYMSPLLSRLSMIVVRELRGHGIVAEADEDGEHHETEDGWSWTLNINYKEVAK